eukprot:COSAG06_NODE_12409_length_1385_cov_2.157854_3_plen_180_part_00
MAGRLRRGAAAVPHPVQVARPAAVRDLLLRPAALHAAVGGLGGHRERHLRASLFSDVADRGTQRRQDGGLVEKVGDLRVGPDDRGLLRALVEVDLLELWLLARRDGRCVGPVDGGARASDEGLIDRSAQNRKAVAVELDLLLPAQLVLGRHVAERAAVVAVQPLQARQLRRDRPAAITF